jgi:peptidoglycan/xylan/chitin deacetylase (PgdA/CDA1 family)
MKFFVITARRLIGIVCAAAFIAAACIGARGIGVFKVGGREIPVYCVQRSDNKIALTFDCAWNDSDIASICETLKRHNVRATFFLVGDWAEKYPDSVRLLAENGHEIGNHSYNHAHYSRLSENDMLADMDKCDSVIRSITGRDVTLFRAPYGEYNDTVVRTCDASGRMYIQWSIDSLDYGGADKESIIRRSTEKTAAGDIILLHNGTDNTAAALDEILTVLCAKFEPVTVSELVYTDNYEIDHTGRQSKVVSEE